MTRKEEIVHTCMDIFSESGAQGLTMKAIAERVNITEPAIYRHFQNKQAMIIAMIDKIREEIFRRVDDIVGQPLSDVEKLQKIFSYHLTYLKKKKAITLELLSESFFHTHPEVRWHLYSLMTEYHKRILGILSKGIARGEISRRVRPEAAAILFLGALQHLLTIFKVEGDRHKIDSLSEEVFGQFKIILEGGNP